MTDAAAPAILDRLRAAMDGAAETADAAEIEVGRLLDGLGDDAFGLTIALFSAPVLIPTPPPAPQICYAAMGAASICLIRGRPRLWTPAALRRRRLSRRRLGAALDAVARRAPRLTVARAGRWPAFLGGAGRATVGVVTLLMIGLLLLPLPVFGNFTPALATLVLGLGLAHRDGAVVALGHASAVVAVAVTAAIVWATLAAVFWVVG